MNPNNLNCTLMFRESIGNVNLRDFSIICNELTPKTWARLIDKNRVHKVFRNRTNSTPLVLAWSDTIEQVHNRNPWFAMSIYGTPIIYPRCYGMSVREINKKYRQNYTIDDLYWVRYYKRKDKKYFDFVPSNSFSQIQVNYDYFLELFFQDLL